MDCVGDVGRFLQGQAVQEQIVGFVSEQGHGGGRRTGDSEEKKAKSGVDAVLAKATKRNKIGPEHIII